MYNEFELLYYYRSKHEIVGEWLLDIYNPLIWKIIHTFDLTYYKSDVEDYYQVCVVEMFKCLDRFEEFRNVSFKTYFYRCAKTAVLNYIMNENTKSYNQIKGAISLDSVVCEEGGKYFVEAIEDMNIKHYVTLYEDMTILESMVSEKCKSIELKIWKAKIAGYSYNEISKCYGVTHKKIDNTIRKITKLAQNLKYLIK